MAITVTEIYVDGFNRNVTHLAQQSPTRLLPYVDMRASNAESEAWETLGATDFTAKAARAANSFVATPVVDAPWGRRVSRMTTDDAGELVEKDDIIQTLSDPLSNLARSFAMGANRSQDDKIITAALAAAENGDGTTTVLPAGQIVGTGYGADISFDLVTEASKIFLDNDIDPMTKKLAVIGPAQMKKLLQTVEATNADYANKALANGFVQDWMGFDWIVSTRLNSPGAGQRDCFFMTDRAIGFQMNQSINTQVQQDPSASFDYRVYSCWSGGAVRVDDANVVKLEVSE